MRDYDSWAKVESMERAPNNILWSCLRSLNASGVGYIILPGILTVSWNMLWAGPDNAAPESFATPNTRIESVLAHNRIRIDRMNRSFSCSRDGLRCRDESLPPDRPRARVRIARLCFELGRYWLPLTRSQRAIRTPAGSPATRVRALRRYRIETLAELRELSRLCAVFDPRSNGSDISAFRASLNRLHALHAPFNAEPGEYANIQQERIPARLQLVRKFAFRNYAKLNTNLMSPDREGYGRSCFAIGAFVGAFELTEFLYERSSPKKPIPAAVEMAAAMIGGYCHREIWNDSMRYYWHRGILQKHYVEPEDVLALRQQARLMMKFIR